jgi:transposase
MTRGDLTDQEGLVIGPLLPSERGRWARPAGDNRLFLNGMLHALRTCCPWRDMHERYGRWNPVYVRFPRSAEQGVWDALLQTLVDLGLTNDWQHMIDSTVVLAHSQATGAKGRLIRLCPYRKPGLGLQSHRGPDEAACPEPHGHAGRPGGGL